MRAAAPQPASLRHPSLPSSWTLRWPSRALRLTTQTPALTCRALGPASGRGVANVVSAGARLGLGLGSRCPLLPPRSPLPPSASTKNRGAARGLRSATTTTAAASTSTSTSTSGGMHSGRTHSGTGSSSYTLRRGSSNSSSRGSSSSSGRGGRPSHLMARVSAAGSSPQWGPTNPVDLVKREVGLQSTRLQPELRERVEAAVERLGGRVTVGDVAARAGVKVAEADAALKALAYDTQAALQVSSEGDVVYGFAPDFRSRLRSRSVLLSAILPAARSVGGALSYLGRIAFGSALIASVVVVWIAITALLRGRDDDNRSGGRGGGYGGGGFGGVRMFMNVTDLFLYWDPHYYRTSAQRVASGQELSFVESIFSFVFGDGDPNTDFEERRWQRLGELIRDKGGVVTAEEMAPYLDPPEPADAATAVRPYDRYGNTTSMAAPYVPYPDEGFVLPALIKFGGEPVVDEQGRLVYRFPALQRTGVKQARWANRFSPKATSEVPLERAWDFTAATSGQVAGTLLLGAANLIGVGVLTSLMADPRSAYILAAQGLGWVGSAVGPLQVYAAAFFLIPAARWYLTSSRNREIDARNDSRAAAADLLNGASAASGAAAAFLEEKVAAARRLGERAAAAAAATAPAEAAAASRGGRRDGAGGRLGPRLVGDEDVIFDSGRETAGQIGEVEIDDWDARMAGREQGQGGRRGGGGGGGGGGGWQGRRDGGGRAGGGGRGGGGGGGGDAGWR